MAKKLIMVPYAYIQNMSAGVNIKNKSNLFDTYMKSCCVTLVSAKKHNFSLDIDVALVTNVDVPDLYKKILEMHNICIYKIPFDIFRFDLKYNWSAAFYKLCALYHIVRETDYDSYCYLDSDIYVQSSFENIWKEVVSNILLYDTGQGLNTKNYEMFNNEAIAFLKKRNFLTFWGGEFFAANKENALLFSDKCLEIYNKMQADNFQTKCGDEFIVSIAAERLKHIIKNAGAYVFRFWTGDFYLVSTCYKYNAVSALHVPAEKDKGLIKIFDKYVKKGVFPKNNKAHRLLHISKRPFISSIKALIKSLLGIPLHR